MTMETSSRRKACDTCFKKKIKCDMLKPACSNCLLYKVRCSTTMIRRRTAPAPAAAAAAPAKETTHATNIATGGDDLQARLARIEAKLDKLGDPSLATTTDKDPSDASNLVDNSMASSANTHSGFSGLCRSERYGEYCLPPLAEIMPVVDDYFRDFNSALPLFHQPHFLTMLCNFYSERELGKNSRAVWAAINVVLALGYRVRTADVDEVVLKFDDVKIRQCIDNAQKELDELVTREEDLLGIQVLLGLVILFQTSTDQKPASVLISTAVRLAHRLQLHVKSSLSEFSPEIAQHRSNVFWLCYILDKDVCFRLKIPSIQNDDDVDLDLPLNNGNYLQSIDGRSQLNYLRVRVQLAYLEGKIYDYLLSNRSSKLSPEARQEKVSHLARMLNAWLQRIPASLQLDKITETLGRAPLSHMILLYHTYLMCYTALNGLFSLESPWLKSVDGLSGAIIRYFASSQTHACARHHLPLLPRYWDTCVRASRGCLNILDNKSYSGCNLWLGGCAYFSAFVVLLANIIYFPTHELVVYDRELTTKTMERVEKLLEYSKSFKTLRVVLVSLDRAANYALEKAKGLSRAYEQGAHGQMPNAQPRYTSYPPPSRLDMFSVGSGQNLAAQPDIFLEPAWSHDPILKVPGTDLADFDFSGEISAPAFMQELA